MDNDGRYFAERNILSLTTNYESLPAATASSRRSNRVPGKNGRITNSVKCLLFSQRREVEFRESVVRRHFHQGHTAATRMHDCYQRGCSMQKAGLSNTILSHCAVTVATAGLLLVSLFDRAWHVSSFLMSTAGETGWFTFRPVPNISVRRDVLPSRFIRALEKRRGKRRAVSPRINHEEARVTHLASGARITGGDLCTFAYSRSIGAEYTWARAKLFSNRSIGAASLVARAAPAGWPSRARGPHFYRRNCLFLGIYGKIRAAVATQYFATQIERTRAAFGQRTRDREYRLYVGHGELSITDTMAVHNGGLTFRPEVPREFDAFAGRIGAAKNTVIPKHLTCMRYVTHALVSYQRSPRRRRRVAERHVATDVVFPGQRPSVPACVCVCVQRASHAEMVKVTERREQREDIYTLVNKSRDWSISELSRAYLPFFSFS